MDNPKIVHPLYNMFACILSSSFRCANADANRHAYMASVGAVLICLYPFQVGSAFPSRISVLTAILVLVFCAFLVNQSFWVHQKEDRDYDVGLEMTGASLYVRLLFMRFCLLSP